MEGRRLIVTGVLISLTMAVLSAVGTSAPAPAARDAVPGQYIVVFHDWVDNPATEATGMALQHGLGVLHVYEHALKGFAAVVPPGMLRVLESDARVAFVNEDRVVSIAGPGAAVLESQSVPTGIARIDGDASSAASGNGSGSVNVGVAIIDTGIDIDHPDLNVAGGKNCSSGKSFDDGNGHGTHVAGTVAAKDDGIGVVGVAPGAPLYAVRVLNNAGSGTWSSVICGVDWVTVNAAGLKIKVANMSLGGGGSEAGSCATDKDALHKAICASVNTAGVTYVVAAGNSNADFKGFVPAAYNEVLTVTAMADFNGQPGGGASATCRADVDDTAADFSNWTTSGGSDTGHAIAAPGVCIYSAWKGGGYSTISGTSMASPHVAGVAALCIAGSCVGMSPGQVIAKLRGDAAASSLAAYGFAGDPRSPSSGRYYGYLVHAGGY